MKHVNITNKTHIYEIICLGLRLGTHICHLLILLLRDWLHANTARNDDIKQLALHPRTNQLNKKLCNQSRMSQLQTVTLRSTATSEELQALAFFVPDDATGAERGRRGVLGDFSSPSLLAGSVRASIAHQ